MKATQKEIETLADRIARQLFTGHKKMARRLILEFEPNEFEGAGWSELAVRNRIAEALRDANGQ